jgi:predicted nucleic acid-binding protein
MPVDGFASSGELTNAASAKRLWFDLEVASVLLDTTVLIDLLRGRPEAARRLRTLRIAGDAPYVCAVNVEETVRGLRPRELAPARALFAGLRIAPLGAAEGWQAGEWRREFARRGRTLSQADCLVAAAALALGGRLATGNPRDFPMRDVTVEHWPVGA